MAITINKNLSRLEKAERFWGWVMLMPLVLGLGIFYFIPFLQNIFYSFTDLDQFMNWTYLSLDNYTRLFFEDDDIWYAIGNTIFYVVICVPIILSLSLLLAIGLNQHIRIKGLYRTLLFLPAITMPAAVAMVWKWLFNKDFGLINQMLNYLNLDSIGWLSNPDIVRISISIVIIWSSLAVKVIILLAGLQSIPKQVYEACEIDGIGKLRVFFFITLPLMVPTLFFVSIMTFIEVLQVFDVVFLIFGNTLMQEQVMTITYIFYKFAFTIQEKGYASAITVVLFIVTLLITLIQMLVGKKLNVN